MSDAVLFDGWYGEPIAWARVGEPVIANEWTEHGQRAVTEWLTPAAAVRQYGPITEVVLGLNGGFQSVTYGDKKFVSRQVDPRGSGLYDDSVVKIDDPVRDDHECPVCGVAPGAPCIDDKEQPRGSHRKRREGRSRWEIERAEATAAKLREESLAAEAWAQQMATAPALGDVVEIEKQKYENFNWIPLDPDPCVVLRTYANRVVEARAEDDSCVFLARNEHSGRWFQVCGEPTSTRLPCRNYQCHTRHKEGLQLRNDQPW